MFIPWVLGQESKDYGMMQLSALKVTKQSIALSPWGQTGAVEGSSSQILQETGFLGWVCPLQSSDLSAWRCQLLSGY